MLVLLASAPLAAQTRLPLTRAQAEAVGRMIWRNEGGGRVENLTHWNPRENFASMGIGHFIWYPAGAHRTFTESFPLLARWLSASGARVPAWALARNCPWPNRKAFDAARGGQRLRSLRSLLSRTVAAQALFMAARARVALPKLLRGLPDDEQAVLAARYDRLSSTPNGVYALVDYVNFKGEGVSALERYQGVGWGLRQVLLQMSDGSAKEAPAAFSEAASTVLRRRVALSPAWRGERFWLPGWLARVATYKQPLY
ncbi:MAG: hypothetical protein KGO96_03555 [Elusimicrobia bacterium]|nr:hypothetical protein [Elusimicrobiota bacterium]MDE2424969.1 hypothetical protein [Elusimicrobiota bacterium]